MYDSSCAIWDIWRELSTLYRLFVVVLTAVTIHSFISTATIIKGVRAIRGLDTRSASIHSGVARLQARCANLRQIHGAAVYLFGFLLFVGLQGAFHTLGLSKTPLLREIFENLKLHFVFAANVLVVFLALHLLQWVASLCVQASVQRLHD